MDGKEARIVAEERPPTNDGVIEEAPARRQDVDVLLDVQELEVERIHLAVGGLRAHVSVIAELAGLVNLQVGVDARLEEVELEIEGVKAKVLLKVRLDDVRAILVHALDAVAEHPEILEALTRALDEVLTGTLGEALGELEGVLGDLEVGGTVDEALEGSLEEVRDALREVLSRAGGGAQGGGGRSARGALPKGSNSGRPSYVALLGGGRGGYSEGIRRRDEVEDARVLSDGGRGKSRRSSGKAKGRAKEAERERGRRKGRGGLLGDTLPKL